METRQLLTLWLTLSVSVPGTGSPPPTVNGALGHSVSLPPGIPVGPDVAEVWWSRTSPRTRIVKYSKGHIEYSGTEYKRRVTLHPGNFSLEIRDLRREDAGDYEVDVTASSGAENKTTVRLEVSEPVSRPYITVQYTSKNCDLTLTCSVTSGNPTSFRWWRGGESVRNDSTHHLWEHGETVEIHHTAEVEDVVYRCEARNPVSEVTAQIQLWDVCKLHTPAPDTTTPPIVLAVLVMNLLISAFIVILLVIRRRRAAGTEGPAETGTDYEIVHQMENRRAGRQPPEGNKGHEDGIYTVQAPPSLSLCSLRCTGSPRVTNARLTNTCADESASLLFGLLSPSVSLFHFLTFLLFLSLPLVSLCFLTPSLSASTEV
ncbi:SLAM family member 8-like isoform X2 [Pristis pectinata]|uniref:SLAM family member 8-like isoform X2 n=1 Tax=Pristis pectinata TaxID=685728 RepID=UPI00223D6511|nr:SLAM family member 8-like isoform X2 [Pristis pectinata]